VAVSLPVVPLPTDIVAVAGHEVKVRGLSRAEAIKLATFGGDLDLVENFMVACGVGVTDDEAAEWRNTTPPDVVEPVLERIAELSGLVEGAQKSG
jgi:hypothetical protein